MTQDLALRKRKALLFSIAASTFLSLLKAIAGLASGSLALSSDAAQGLLDIGLSTLTFFAVRAADRPADANHSYGHSKIESLAALAETVLLILTSGAIFFFAAQRLILGQYPTEISWLTFTVLFIAVVTDFFRWRHLNRVAQETHSEALAVEAFHFLSDFLATFFIGLGLVGVYFGYGYSDNIAALGIACFIAFSGYRLGKKTVDTLTDALPSYVTQYIGQVIRNSPEVVQLKSLRLRRLEGKLIGEIDVSVPRILSFQHVDLIKQKLLRRIRAHFPNAELNISAHPCITEQESTPERISLVAAKASLPIHHVTVQEINGQICVNLDVELPAHMLYGEAHALATSLEKRIRRELGEHIEVETHIEPQEQQELKAEDLTHLHGHSVEESLCKHAAATGFISGIHDVRVRGTMAGWVVNYHGYVDKSLTVSEVHQAIDHIDHSVLQTFPQLIRIVGHAEPNPPLSS